MSKWHTDEIQSAPLIDEQCTMFARNWLFDEISRCEAKSTHKVVAACVHEHIVEYTACERCAKPRKTLYCNACADSAEPHECPMRVTVTELVL